MTWHRNGRTFASLRDVATDVGRRMDGGDDMLAERFNDWLVGEHTHWDLYEHFAVSGLSGHDLVLFWLERLDTICGLGCIGYGESDGVGP